MKKIKYILIVLLMGVVQSCEWLDLKPVDTYGGGDYWNTKDQVDRFIRSLHIRVRSRHEVFFKMGEVRGGTFIGSSASLFNQGISDVPVVNNNLSASNPGLSGWGGLYADIMQINYAIAQIPATTFLTDEEKDYDMGILHGLRAYYYFHLFRTYGGVPLIETARVMEGAFTPGDLNKPRATEEEIYDFILKDVKASDEFLAKDDYTISTIDKSSYWSKAATKMLKAEVLLWGCKVRPIGGTAVYSKDIASDLATAKADLEDITGSGKYGIDSKLAFSDVFSVAKEDNKEMIFTLRYTLNETNSFYVTFLYPTNTYLTGFVGPEGQDYTAKKDPLELASGGTSSGRQYTLEFFKTFRPEDTRRKATFFDVYRKSDNAAAILMYKFQGEKDISDIRRFTNDWPIYRYADLQLMLAEIVAMQNGDPAPYINSIRNRAYGANSKFKYPYEGETAEEAILEERSKEFVAEGKRWYDIRRMMDGKYARDLQINVNGEKIEQHLLWPIDNATMTNDPLIKQTPGY